MLLQILIIIIIIILLYVSSNDNECIGKKKNVIPKIIWTYWDKGELPEIVKLCIINWENLNPDYNIVLVTRQNIAKYSSEQIPKNFERMSPQRQSDWVRLAVLKGNGGFWIDSTIILTDNFDWIDNFIFGDIEGLAYFNPSHTIDNKHPIIESWFIVAKKNSRFIASWFKEFDYACKKFGNSGSDYVSELAQKYPAKIKDIVANIPKLIYQNYLTIHICASKIAQIDNINPQKYFSLLNCYEGPFRGSTKKTWRSPKYLKEFLTGFPTGKNPKMIKLVNHEQKFVLAMLQNCIEGSYCDQYLKINS